MKELIYTASVIVVSIAVCYIATQLLNNKKEIECIKVHEQKQNIQELLLLNELCTGEPLTLDKIPQ